MDFHNKNIYFTSCNSFSILGVFILFLSLSAILLNSIPLYSFMSWNWKENKDELKGFLQTIKVFITAVVCVDFCTMMLAIPSYLLLEFINYDCIDSWVTDPSMFHNVCGSWAILYFGLKLSSLFLVAFGSYTTYLHSKENDGFKSTPYFSCNEPADENENKINENKDKKNKHFSLFILIGLFVLSFFIGAQPLLNIGPVENMNFNRTSKHGYICDLRSFVKPQTEKQYAFPFSLIMASGGCLFLLLFILVKRGNDTKKTSTSLELKKLTSLQACVYMVTWTPLLITMSLWISNKDLPEHMESIIVLITMMPSVINPILYLCYLTVARNAFIQLCGCVARKKSKDDVEVFHA